METGTDIRRRVFNIVNFFRKNSTAVADHTFGIGVLFSICDDRLDLWFSVPDWDGLDRKLRFAGFGPYIGMNQRLYILDIAKKTLAVIHHKSPFCMLIGLGLAIVMDQGTQRNQTCFATCFLLPFPTFFFRERGRSGHGCTNPSNGITEFAYLD